MGTAPGTWSWLTAPLAVQPTTGNGSTRYMRALRSRLTWRFAGEHSARCQVDEATLGYEQATKYRGLVFEPDAIAEFVEAERGQSGWERSLNGNPTSTFPASSWFSSADLRRGHIQPPTSCAIFDG